MFDIIGATAIDPLQQRTAYRSEEPNGPLPSSRPVADTSAARVDISADYRRMQAASPRESSIQAGETELTEQEKQEVNRLKKRDQEVRAHEQAHMAAGAGIIRGGAQYKMVYGPDGKAYVADGEVKIDTSPEKDPRQTISKMQQVRRAALAPADPSGTDRAVAAQAAQVEAQARMELSEQQSAARKATGDEQGANESVTPSSPTPSQPAASTGPMRGQKIRVAA